MGHHNSEFWRYMAVKISCEICHISSATINTTEVLKESDHQVLRTGSGKDLMEKRDEWEMKFTKSIGF